MESERDFHMAIQLLVQRDRHMDRQVASRSPRSYAESLGNPRRRLHCKNLYAIRWIPFWRDMHFSRFPFHFMKLKNIWQTTGEQKGDGEEARKKILLQKLVKKQCKDIFLIWKMCIISNCPFLLACACLFLASELLCTLMPHRDRHLLGPFLLRGFISIRLYVCNH